MQNEREAFSKLIVRDYDIAGNLLRVFTAQDGRIVFVLDLRIDARKPNVLLVIDAVNNRKWDDILENDYGVDLETIRPKKDNKYQKLDIEYSGLPVYQAVIDAYIAGQDISEELSVLESFRKIAIRRSAVERLSVAETAADNARDTIEKANEAIEDLTARVRQLRAKLTELRKNIGKEPTKQSASKILRTESQIDATNEKIRRAKKRLENAHKRLVVAIDDADVARGILAQDDTVNGTDLPMVANEKPLAVSQTKESVRFVPAESEDNDELEQSQDENGIEFFPVVSESEDTLTINNTKAEEMAEEEVKPLFDKDPEILDEEIAFQPIDFGAPIVAPENPIAPIAPDASVSLVEPEIPAVPVVAEEPTVYEEPVAFEPLTFTPPTETDQYHMSGDLSGDDVVPAPVLDSITAVDTPSGIVESQTEFVPQPVAPAYATPSAAPVAPDTDVAPAPINSGFRPVSPITGSAVASAAVAKKSERGKQSAAYYIMLIVLIALSVFVLWFYQKSTGKSTLPGIVETVAPEEALPVEPVTEPVQEPEPEPQPEPIPEPEPQPKPEPEPEPVEPVEIVVPVTAPVINTVPTVVPEPEVAKVVETEEEIVAKKPAYGVSQNEAMFVADEAFETDRLAADVVSVDMYDTPIVRVPDVAPAVQFQEPEIIQEYLEEDAQVCENGSPDRFGCCPGETYTQIDNGGFVCCPDAGGDCFPPLL